MDDKTREAQAKAHRSQIEGAEVIVKCLCYGIFYVAAGEPELFHSAAQILTLLLHIVSAAFIFGIVDAGVHGLYHRYCMTHSEYDKPAPKLRVFMYGAGVVLFVLLINGLWLT